MRLSLALLIFGMAIPACSAQAIEVCARESAGIYYGGDQNYRYNGVGGFVRWYLSDRTALEPEFSIWHVNNSPSTLYSVTLGVSHDFRGGEHRLVPSWFWDIGLAKVLNTSSPLTTDYYVAGGVGLNLKYSLSDRIFVETRVRGGFFLHSAEASGGVGFVVRRAR